MNNVDRDRRMIDVDAYGNLLPKAKAYKGFAIDAGVTIKVWRPDGRYFGRFANEKAAKAAIRDAGR